MTLRGIVQAAELVENPPGGETIEMLVRAQGVGPSQPRRFVIPHELLIADDSLDPDLIKGLSFEADIEEEAPGRWRAMSIRLASRMLRPEE